MVSIKDPLTLPCGATLRNRLAKAALTEGLATADGLPTAELNRLYGHWADGGAGLLITGNIQIDRFHLERPGNVIVDETVPPGSSPGVPADETMEIGLRRWAAVATRGGNHCWVQISHSGRQTQKGINPHPKAPSAVKLGLPGGKFGDPEPLTTSETRSLVERFARAAKRCQDAGFTGVQFHAAHGYLLSEFLSPLVNHRADDYGGSLRNRSRLLLEVVQRTREKVGPSFPIAVKLNSADFQKGGFKFEDSLLVVQWLQDASVDLVEISGGTYEQPAMMGVEGLGEREDQHVRKAASTLAREAYFVDFAKAMQEAVQVPLMLTGGFRTLAAMSAALESEGVDVIGLGRPLCVMTDAPKKLLEGQLQVLPSYEDHLGLVPDWLWFLKRFNIVKVIDGFAHIYWFYEQIIMIGQTGRTDPNLGAFAALRAVESRHQRLLMERSSELVERKEDRIETNKWVVFQAAVALAVISLAVFIGSGSLYWS